MAGLVGAPVGDGGGAVRAEVALHCLLVGVGRGEAERGGGIFNAVIQLDYLDLVFLHCDIGVIVQVASRDWTSFYNPPSRERFRLHGYVISCGIYILCGERSTREICRNEKSNNFGKILRLLLLTLEGRILTAALSKGAGRFESYYVFYSWCIGWRVSVSETARF